MTFQHAVIPDCYRFHALITTYEVIIQDVELLSQIEWRCCIIDEAHRLKNQKCKLNEGLKVGVPLFSNCNCHVKVCLVCDGSS